MINENSISAVDASRWSTRFRKPLYDSYSFYQIPQLIRWLLTDTGADAVGTGASPSGLPADTLGPFHRKYDTVILFFIDSLGWRFVQEHLDTSPFLQSIAAEGVVSKLTSQFPSTTAAHFTTIHTGLPVGQTGVYEWYYYEPLVDAVIAPLLYSFAGDRARGTLQSTGVAPAALYPTTTLHAELVRHGVQSTVLSDGEYARSPYSNTVCAGAQIVPYRTLPEALVNLRRLLRAQQGKAFYHLYFDRVDHVCHRYGPESPQVAAEIEALLLILEKLWRQQVEGRLKNTLFLLTADHGQVAIDPRTTVYLNRDLPHVVPWLKTTRAGQPIVPAGSSRDMFLHVKEEHLEEAQADLTARLEGRAEIYRVDELASNGFFGPGEPSPVFWSRVGNLVILPYAGETVWWFERSRFEQNLQGAHGGLTPEEMETVLLAQAYD